MPFSVPALIKYISNSMVLNNVSPFLVDRRIRLNSLAGTTVYGVKHPGTLSVTKYAKIQPGVLVANTTITLPTTLNPMDDQAAAGLTAANRMRVIVVKNGSTVLTRVGNDATAAAGQFNELTTTTMRFGDALIASDIIEVFVMDAADIKTISGGALTAGRDYEDLCYTFMFSAGNLSIEACATK